MESEFFLLRNMRKYLALSILFFLLAACTGEKKTQGRNITVTIEPLRYFTEQIAGSKFQVSTMVPQGSNPETYEPTTRQMVKLADSQLYFKVGNIGFERTWMKRLTENVPDLKVIDTSRGIPLAKSSNGVPDPHTWMSCKNAIILSGNIYKALVCEDPQDQVYFKRNLDRLVSRIHSTDSQIRSILQKSTGRSFLIYHPALTYFAREYHLKQLPIEEEGREPSAAQLRALIAEALKEHARVMLIQKEFSSRNTAIVTSGTHARQEVINPLDYNWQKSILHIAYLLK
jgi:zinc transport system substrate-binding protein